MSEDLENFSENELWTATLDYFKFDNNSAVFYDLLLDVDSNGTVDLTLGFYAESPNNEYFKYQVSIGKGGKLSFLKITLSDTVRIYKGTIHPLDLLKVLSSFELIEKNVYIDVLCESGITIKDTDDWNLFVLYEDGLKQIKYISLPKASERITTWKNGSDFSNFYFLMEDVQRAKEVEYY